MRFITILAILLLNLISNPASAQGNNEVDSFLNLIKASNNDSLKMRWYNNLRRVTYYNNSEESFKYTEQYLALALKNDYPKEIALAQFYMGNAHVTKTNYNEALKYYLKAAAYYEQEKDSLKMASVFNGIGAAYENSGNDSSSLIYFEKSQMLAQLTGDKRRNAIALSNISNIYTRQGKTKLAISYLERSVTHLTKADEQYYYPIALNLANAYIDNDELDKASKIFTSVLASVNVVKDAYSYLLAKKGLGNIALEKEDYKTAVNNLEESFKVATDQEFFEQRYFLMKDLINAYSYNKDYKKGLDLFFEYQTIKDSIFTSEKDKNLAEAIQKYETEKKDIALQKQEIQIEDQHRLKNWLISGSVLLALVAIFIFVVYKKRLKYEHTIAEQTKAIQQQKITELEQGNKLTAMNSMIAGQEAERMRIAKDLHDGLGGLLSSVKAHFTSIKTNDNTAVYTKTNLLIDEACVEVRRIAHNMMPHALSIAGLEDTLIDLGESLRQDGIKTIIEVNKLPVTLDDTKSVMIYRLAQELIANIRKHADAKNVLLQFLANPNAVSLTIEDDGKGFDIEEQQQQDGLGLKSIFSRVKFLDGTINFDSRIGEGSTITVEIPIP